MDLIGVIPAAGRASRMGEIGASLPKALIEVEGRTLLERSIETLKTIGVSRIVVVVGHLREQVQEFIAGRHFGIEITTAYQEKPLGLAHAIAAAATQIDGNFVVLCPDNIYTDENDLRRAREVFESRSAAFVLLATVTPNTQRDRKSYFTAAHRNLEPNVYEYGDYNEVTSGLAINSTGCVFFKYEALDFVPCFIEPYDQWLFSEYLDLILEQRDGLIYLLRGMRYDFSEPADVETYRELQTRLLETKGNGVSAILINPLGQVLLQQRDDNPAIRYPGHWSLFGGTIEEGESPVEAVMREVGEEIHYQMRNFGMFREFVQNNKREFAFAGELPVPIDELILSEGQGMDFFYPSQLKELQIRPDDKDTLEQYFGV